MFKWVPCNATICYLIFNTNFQVLLQTVVRDPWEKKRGNTRLTKRAISSILNKYELAARHYDDSEIYI
jgi:hypothetical protein